MTSFDARSGDYDGGRVGYANEVYTTLAGFGLAPHQKIVDIGCGTGLASAPLIESGYRVTGVDISVPMLGRARARFPEAHFVEGAAEDLPFQPQQFDAAICAQAFHHFDRTAAMREILRVLRPGGIVAVWWKHLMSDDAVKIARDEAAVELGFEPIASGLRGGFKEFYAAPFSEHSLRVIPWRMAQPLSQYMQYERSRASVADKLGDNAGKYFTALERRLRERQGAENPVLSLSFMHYVYLGKK